LHDDHVVTVFADRPQFASCLLTSFV
jgi:hypothetical protein